MKSKMTLAVVVFLSAISNVVVGQFQIAPWYKNQSCAVSLTFDDWSPGHPKWAVPQMIARGAVGSFYVTTINAYRFDDYDIMREAAANGIEIGNHTETHRRLSTVPVAELDQEIDDVKDFLDMEVDNQVVTTFVYPLGDFNTTVMNKVMVNHIGARGIFRHWTGGWPYDFASSEADYFNVNTYGVNSSVSTTAFENEILKGINDGGLVTFMFHSINDPSMSEPDTWWDEISGTHFNNLLDIAVGHQNEIWLATFEDAIKYHKEANAAELMVVSNDAAEIILYIEDGLADDPYDHPLTVNYSIPDGESYTSVMQGGASLEFTQEDGILTFHGRPDGSNIVIAKDMPTGVTGAVRGVNTFEVYPNPTSGLVQVAVDLEKQVEGELVLTDLQGVELPMYAQVVSLASGGQQRFLDLSELDSGVYFVMLKTEDGIARSMVTKK